MKIIIRVAALLLLMAAGPGQAITIDISPSSSQVMVGHQASVDIIISGLGGNTPPALGAYDIGVAYDQTILGLDYVTFGSGLDVLGLVSLTEAFLVVPGLINLFELSLYSTADLELLQPSSFTLATLVFDTISVGLSSLSLGVNSLSDADGTALNAVVSSAEIAVVPEPGTWMLMLLGIAGIGLLSRRCRLSSTDIWNGVGLKPGH
jgi:hypothetical protein